VSCEDYEPIDPRQPWIGHPREAEFEASFAQHEREMEACTCEWDVDGRTPKRGCLTHAQEDDDNGAFDEDEPHASDCAFWCDEPCDCSARFVDRETLIDDAMSTVEARPLDQTITDCTGGERPRK
jgi:hypothetical protein